MIGAGFGDSLDAYADFLDRFADHFHGGTTVLDDDGSEGEGDDEQIKVDLSKVPENVKSLVFTVNSFSGETFDQIENAYCRVVDSSNNAEIARYTLSSQGSHTALIMAKLYRHNGEWKMHAVGENGVGRTIDALLPQIVVHL